MWGIGGDEPHRDALGPGDLALVYLAAPERAFIGRVEVATAAHDWTASEADAYPGDSPGGVVLARVEAWEPAVPMAATVRRLDPAGRNPLVQANAEAGFRTGLVRITPDEYEAVLALGPGSRGAPERGAPAARELRAAVDAYRVFSTVTELPGATLLRVPEAAFSPMVNRVVGLGLEGPATEAELDAALAAMSAGTSFYVSLAPGAGPPELERWLEARGLVRGWGWMLFRRPVTDPPATATSLRIAPVEDARGAADFARVVAASHGFPPSAEPVLARGARAGWRCFLALDGDEPAAAAGLYPSGGVGYLGAAGTLPAHRGRGAQRALIAERIRAAGALGCDVVVTETGKRRDERASASYRNILRAGFEEAGVIANWLGGPAARGA